MRRKVNTSHAPNAFINQVRALEQSGRLDAATAEGVIAHTQAIISQL